ncbi:AAA family ATPase [Nocardioides sp.]|uniref:AAA family ATPase n=1 Tax=Nocardioides sp. TaxID=35761 RepID=UPI00272769AD|nr:AAA family ATPase [Nocardioides sp.]MDO9455992.1 AAA family ATPase [Nocardioides sp.]
MTGSKRFRHGLVLGKFWPLHAGHQHLIDEALAACDRVTVQLLATRAEDVPLAVRAAWLRELHPAAQLVAAYDETPVDFDDPAVWDLHMAVIEEHLDAPVDAVLTSDDYGAELARRLGAAWVQVDPGRRDVPVSGTAVRADPGSHWAFLAPPVRAHYVRRVVVTGAESTGSTTLAQALAERLGCPWVPEYGRHWSEVRPGGLEAPWRTDEFVHIVREQCAAEDAAARTTPVPWLVCDTDAQATTLWHERYVGHLSPVVAEAATAQVRPWARILSGDEIPWVQDGMRDGEEIRHTMQDRFRATLDDDGVPWLEVTGSVEARVEQALAFVARPQPAAAPA